MATSSWELSGGKTNIEELGRRTWEVLEYAESDKSPSGLEVEGSQAAGSGQVRMGVKCQGQGCRGSPLRLPI